MLPPVSAVEGWLGGLGTRSYELPMSKVRYRKHIRLKGCDYSDPGYYFVTICTRGWEKLFAPVVDPKYGRFEDSHVAAASYAAQEAESMSCILVRCLRDLEGKYYENLEIDFYCIMPDHVHLILAFQGKVFRKGAIGSRSYKLSEVVTALKAVVSRDIGRSVWQPNYYEHVIRNEHALHGIRKYILNNPSVEHEAIDWGKLDR